MTTKPQDQMTQLSNGYISRLHLEESKIPLTIDRLNALSNPTRPSFKQYSVNATSSADMWESRPDISVTYTDSDSIRRQGRSKLSQ